MSQSTTNSRQLLQELHALKDVTAPSTILPTVLGELGLVDRYFTLDSAIGPLLVAFSDQGITAVRQASDEAAFVAAYPRTYGRPLHALAAPPTTLARAIANQLAGKKVALRFDLRACSTFEQATLRKALEIPRGEVRPYAWIAREIGKAGAVRAVGSALGRNPVPLLIPCHRIIRSDGQIGEYIFGSSAKRTILQTEGLDPTMIEQQARAKVRFLGSDTTHIYCFPTCHNARRITPEHLITFTSEAAAEQAGYRPCKACRPAHVA